MQWEEIPDTWEQIKFYSFQLKETRNKLYYNTNPRDRNESGEKFHISKRRNLDISQMLYLSDAILSLIFYFLSIYSAGVTLPNWIGLNDYPSI